jgi:hypothetical protein
MAGRHNPQGIVLFTVRSSFQNYMRNWDMDYSKLLFAAQVRKLATELRQAERDEVKLLYARSEEADRQDALSAWDEEFSMSFFVSRAYSEITEVAEQINVIQGEQQVSGRSFWDLNDDVNASGAAKP